MGHKIKFGCDPRIVHKSEQQQHAAHDHDARSPRALRPCGTTSPFSLPAHLPRRSANDPSDAPAPFEHQCAASCWRDSHAQAAKSPARRPPFHDLLSGTARLHRRGEGAPRRRGDGGRDTCRTSSLASPAATAQRGFGSGAGSSARQGGHAPGPDLDLAALAGLGRDTGDATRRAGRARRPLGRSCYRPRSAGFWVSAGPRGGGCAAASPDTDLSGPRVARGSGRDTGDATRRAGRARRPRG